LLATGAVPLGQLHSTQPGRRVPVAAHRLATAGPQRPGLSRHLGADRLRPGRHRPPGVWPLPVAAVQDVVERAPVGPLDRPERAVGGDAEVDQPGPEPVIGRDPQGPGCCTVCGTLRRCAWRSRCWWAARPGGWPPEAKCFLGVVACKSSRPAALSGSMVEVVLGRRELAWPEAKRAYHRGGSS
jgi:hypothetical protein